MGQAKQRGTYEVRKKQSIQNQQKEAIVDIDRPRKTNKRFMQYLIATAVVSNFK